MSTFTYTASNGSALLPIPSGSHPTVNGWCSASAASNGIVQNTPTPAVPYIDVGNYIGVLAFGSYNAAGPPAPYPTTAGAILVLNGTWVTPPFALCSVGTFNLDPTVGCVVSTTLLPGCTTYLWGVGNLGLPGSQAVTISGAITIPEATGSSLQYQLPTGAISAYDPLQAQTAISWTASVDGIPLAFTANGTYTVDPTANVVKVDSVGGGGGGMSGDYAGGYVGGGAGGGGGGYAHGEYLINGLGASIAVVVPASSAGGASNTSGGANYGVNGSQTSFGVFLFGNGGQAATSGNSNLAQPGGTGLCVGGVNATVESGGIGGAQSTNTIDDFARAGGATTKAGGGGGGGSRSGNGSGNPIPPVFNNAGGASSVSAGGPAGTSTLITGSGVGVPVTATAAAGTLGASTGPFGGGGGGGGGYAFADTSGNGHTQANTGPGGNGGAPGGGGGGGGGGIAFDRGGGTGILWGRGGDGGPGYVLTTTYWAHYHDPQYLVYRNGVLIGTTPRGVTTFVDLSPHPGLNTYTVYASYDGATRHSASSAPTSVTLSGGNYFASGAFAPANAFAPVMLINVKGIKPKFYAPVIAPNMRSRR